MHRLKADFLIILLLLAAIMLFPLAVGADIYKYVDKNGTTHFVDDLGKIPSEYRNQVTVREEKPKGETEGETPPAAQGKGETPEEARTRRMLEGLEEKKRLEEEKAREEFEKGLVTKVTIHGNSVLVPTTLCYMGKEIQTLLLFDTGAELIVLNQSVADQLSIPLTGGAKVQVGGGRVLNASVAKLDYVRVGPYEAKNIQAWIVPHQGPPTPMDGALGMNFLRGLEYSVDFENKVIRWKAQ